MANISSPRRWRQATAGALFALLGCAALAPAHASYVVGQWDPEYGVPFANLGWRGTTTMLVDDSCLVSAGVVPNNGVACPLMTVLSATVEFYDLVDPMLATIDALDFTTAVALNSIEVDGASQVTSFSFSSTAWVASTSPLAQYLMTQALFGLSVNRVGSDTLASLSWTTDEGSGSNDPRFPAVLRITTLPNPVPEPATLALAGVALMALLSVSRIGRRSRTSRVAPAR